MIIYCDYHKFFVVEKLTGIEKYKVIMGSPLLPEEIAKSEEADWRVIIYPLIHTNHIISYPRYEEHYRQYGFGEAIVERNDALCGEMISIAERIQERRDSGNALRARGTSIDYPSP